MSSLLDDLNDLGSGSENDDHGIREAYPSIRPSTHTTTTSSTSSSHATYHPHHVSTGSQRINPTGNHSHPPSSSHLQDVQDLSSGGENDDDDEGEEEEENDNDGGRGQHPPRPHEGTGTHRMNTEDDDEDDEKLPEGVPLPRDMLLEEEMLHLHHQQQQQQTNASLSSSSHIQYHPRSGLDNIAHLRSTSRYHQFMQKIYHAMNSSTTNLSSSSSSSFTPLPLSSLLSPTLPAITFPPPEPVYGPLEEWPDYKLVVQGNPIILLIDEEMIKVHTYLTDIYSRYFSELITIVPNILEYSKLVYIIRNTSDLTTLIDQIQSILPSNQIMILTLIGNNRKPIPPTDLDECIRTCEEIFALELAKQYILAYIQSRMTIIAPNVCELVSSRIAAILVGIAGGIQALSRIPSCNVQVLGQKKKILAGMSRYSTMPHAGIIYEAPLVLSAPSIELKRRTAKTIAAKVVLAARMDSFRQSPTGDAGIALRKDIELKLKKWQEPLPGRKEKPLKAPDDQPSKKRGGKRARARKARLAMTDVQREASRVSMNGGGEYDEIAMGVDTGMLGTGIGIQGGKLRIERKDQKIFNKKRKLGIGQSGGGGGGGGHGTLSTFAFTPVQGIQFANPNAPSNTLNMRGKGNTKTGSSEGNGGNYFSNNTGTFTTIR